MRLSISDFNRCEFCSKNFVKNIGIAAALSTGAYYVSTFDTMPVVGVTLKSLSRYVVVSDQGMFFCYLAMGLTLFTLSSTTAGVALMFQSLIKEQTDNFGLSIGLARAMSLLIRFIFLMTCFVMASSTIFTVGVSYSFYRFCNYN